MPSTHRQRFGRRGRCRPLPPRLALLLLTVALGPGQAAIRIPAGYQVGEFKQPPEITVQPVSVTAFTADDISLTCEASGNPAPSFRWVKDGEEFDPTSDPQLSTSADSGSFSASGNDPIGEYQGKYSCYAYNGLGTAVSNEVQIIIESALRVGKFSGIYVHFPPRDSRIPLSAADLRHFEQSERVTQGRDGNLYFANVFASDGRDDYTCHAQYISARTILPKEPISLTVTTSNSVLRNRRPQMMHPSGAHSSYLALRGSTLELECIPEGLRDGRVLRFTNISETDSGEYQCMASNSQGVVVHTYTVTVEAAPYWTKSPESQLYAPGETVRLDCQADGIPTPTITWSLNGSPISSVDPDPRRRAEGGTMVMEDVQPGDTAVYQCLASNKHGTALNDFSVYTVVEGQRALLSCETFGSPKPKITCSDTLLSDPRVSQLANGTLQIASIAQEDAGLYTCSVPGANLSITAELDVLNKTAIISPPEYLRVQRGKSGFFTCQAVVDPKLYPPVIQWRMNRKKIFESPYNDKYTLDGSTLAVSDVQSEDEGMYTCEVITRLDMAHASGYITIIDKPDPPTLLQLSAPKDRSLMLSWSPEDDHNSPILEFVVEYEEQQFGKGEWIEVARVTGEVNHVTAPLRPFGTYSFRVTAINELGKSKPSSPSALHSTPPAGHIKPQLSLCLMCVCLYSTVYNNIFCPLGLQEMDQQNFNGPGFQYKVMWRQSIGQGPQWHHNYTSSPPFIVMEAGTFIPFEIKVQAVNDLGEGPEPEPEIGYSGEDTPLEAPVGVGVEVINSTAIKVKWAPVSKDTVRGHLLGYKVHLKRLGPGNRRGRRKRGRNEREGERSDSVTVETGANEEKKVLGGLQPYSRYAVSVTVFNSKGEGPPSEPISFDTPEGVPSHPTSLHLESPSETELTLHWTPPSQPNGVLTGYLLQYQQSESLHPLHSTPKNIVKQLDPQSRYRFYLRGRTSAGDGEAIIKEGATMLDGAPPSNISMSVGETSVNLSWVSGDRHRNVAFHIHYLSKNGGGQWKVSEKLNSTQSFYQLQGLQPGSQYRLQFIFSNNTFWETDIQTQGEGMLELKEGFATQGWFIGLISAIMVLLLVLLILCIIKRTKGGKYSVKDKEEGQVDSEARPMKDEAFGEYSDNEEKGTTSQPSLCEDSKLGSQGSLARLAEAVDGNQDSLLVVQLDGKMDIPGPGDQEALAATSPVNPSEDPPGNPTTPNSITGILD
uniref:L1 cell adhesion molecule, paralog a n=1 Tax=Scleropages formosus TaxID=113540 RepID=A0A8C9W092_SCLFO